MIGELKQNELSKITPIGTNETTEQILYRKLIYQDQIALDIINTSPQVKTAEINSKHLEKIIRSSFTDNNITRYGYSPIKSEFIYFFKIRFRYTRRIKVASYNRKSTQKRPVREAVPEKLL